MDKSHRYHMSEELALHLLQQFCHISARENRRVSVVFQHYARIARENFQRNRDHWYYQDAHKNRHANNIDSSRLHRRAAELVSLYGLRTNNNLYPVTL